MKPEFRLENKNILVTGGAGFIGTNLCEYLILSKANVTCLDNFITGHKKNIKNLLKNPKFKLIEGDIRELSICQKACENQHFVLHHAALGSVPRSIDDPVSSNNVNITGFLNMLIAARDNNVKRFVFAASSSTYGDSEKLPKIENKIGKPLSPYAITKYVNELYADIFQKEYGLNYIGLRYFNVFGRYQDPNGPYSAVIPIFIKKLINKESPIINGDGTFSRDFTYVDNVIQMNILSMLTNKKEALNQIYNTACGEQTSLNQLIKYIQQKLSNFDPSINQIKIIHSKNRKGDIPHSLACIEKSARLLNYKPTHHIKKGLSEALKWYIENLNHKLY